MPDWGELFRVATPIAEIFVRGTVMFLALFAVMRVAGKRGAGAHSLTALLIIDELVDDEQGGGSRPQDGRRISWNLR